MRKRGTAKVLACALAMMVTVSSVVPAQAKTVVVNDYYVTEQFLEQHKSDTVISYLHCFRINKNEGRICDARWGRFNYVRPHIGKNGSYFTMVLYYQKGAKTPDDIVRRIDKLGHIIPIRRNK